MLANCTGRMPEWQPQALTLGTAHHMRHHLPKRSPAGYFVTDTKYSLVCERRCECMNEPSPGPETDDLLLSDASTLPSLQLEALSPADMGGQKRAPSRLCRGHVWRSGKKKVRCERTPLGLLRTGIESLHRRARHSYLSFTHTSSLSLLHSPLLPCRSIG